MSFRAKRGTAICEGFYSRDVQRSLVTSLLGMTLLAVTGLVLVRQHAARDSGNRRVRMLRLIVLAKVARDHEQDGARAPGAQVSWSRSSPWRHGKDGS